MKRPFAPKTKNMSSTDYKTPALSYKKIEKEAPEIAKMFVKLGKIARECKQLIKEADKISSKHQNMANTESSQKKCNKYDDKHEKAQNKYNNKFQEFLKYFEEILSKIDSLKENNEDN